MHEVLPSGTTCYENWIPPFVEHELERIYGSVYASLAFHRLHDGLDGVSTYVYWRDHEVKDLFLFRQDGPEISVITEGMGIDSDAVNRFARYVFTRFPEVQVVQLHAVEARFSKLDYPSQIYACSDDTVLDLPATPDEYIDRLGKTTRKNLRRYQRRLTEEFPDYAYQVKTGSEIDKKSLLAIIDLNRARMRNKNKESGIDEASAERLWQLARTHGLIGMASIGGKLCAGAITYRFGDKVYSFVRAHNPEYDEYRLGLLGGVALLTECISRGIREFHFLWGRQPHKALLGGVCKDLHHVTAYRSYWQLVRHTTVALQNLREAQRRKMLLWAHAQRDQETPLWRTVSPMWQALRPGE